MSDASDTEQRHVKRLRLVDDMAADDDEEGDELDYINDSDEEGDAHDDGSDLKDFITNDDDEKDDGDIEIDPELAELQGDDEATALKRAKYKLQKRRERKIAERRQHMSYDQIQAEKEDQRIENELKQKYGASAFDDVDDNELDDYGDVGGDYTDSIQTNSMIPSISDPKLWLIKCDPGKEEDSVLQILKRYQLKSATPDQRLFIYSAFTTPASHGYVYVEADKEVHVKKSIQGIRALKAWRCTLVPVKEMVSALTFNSTQKLIDVGQWIRIKGGQYKHDLGRVVGVSDHNTRITVKLIPRIDYISLEQAARDGTTDRIKRKRGGVRPQQKLFDVNEIQSIGGMVTRKRGAITDKVQNYYVFMSNSYKNGYLYKDFNISGLLIDDVLPRADEIERFKERKIDADGDDDNDDNELPIDNKQLISTSNSTKHNLSMGDRVVVTSGDTKHVTGRITNLLKDRLSIQPDPDQPIQISLDLQFNQVRKYFQVGDHIKVTTGTHKNESGLITQVRELDGTLTIFSDSNMNELTVNSIDCIETSEVSNGSDSLGQYELGDLVQLIGDDVGVIVKSDASSFKVLTHRGALQSAQLHDIVQQKHSRFATALDGNNNQIQKDDIVNVLHGQYAGKQGTIRHTYRGAVWCYNRSITDNAGYFVAPGKHVAHVNSALIKQQQQQAAQYGMAPPPAQQPYQRGGRPGMDPLKGKTITVTQGTYKGYVGRVVDVTPINVRVELSAITRTIQLNRNQVVERQITAPPLPNQSAYGVGSATPLLGNKTPAYDYYGSKTPAYDVSMSSMTPAHAFGAATPAHQTPSSNVWSAQTPAHSLSSQPVNNDEFDLEQQMMSLGSQQYNTAQYTNNTLSSKPSTADDDKPLWPVNARIDHNGRQGTIQSVNNSDNTCRVEFDDNSIDTVSQTDITPLQPEKNDHVIFIRGKYRGQKGEFLGINSDEAIVDIDGDLQILNIKLLCKVTS